MVAADHMIATAARALCRDHAAVCNVNADDLWKLDAEYFKRMAALALEAAGATDLFASLTAIVKEADGPGKPYDGDSFLPAHFIHAARDAIAKATGGAS